MFKRLLDAYGHIISLTLVHMITTYDIIIVAGFTLRRYHDIVAWHWHNDIVGPRYCDKQVNYIHHLAAPVTPTH